MIRKLVSFWQWKPNYGPITKRQVRLCRLGGFCQICLFMEAISYGTTRNMFWFGFGVVGVVAVIAVLFAMATCQTCIMARSNWGVNVEAERLTKAPVDWLLRCFKLTTIAVNLAAYTLLSLLLPEVWAQIILILAIVAEIIIGPVLNAFVRYGLDKNGAGDNGN